MSDLHKDLKQLGKSADTNSDTYSKALVNEVDPKEWLEKFESPAYHKDMNQCLSTLSLHIESDEFTSLCPMTGQPDFAKIIIDYKPFLHCVESKSLKLYFLAFRNRRDFHETCVNKICNDLVELLDPQYLKVEGQFTPRGGIPFWPTSEYFRTKKTV